MTFRSLAIDAMAVAGFGSLIFGVHQVYEPAAPIIGGALLLVGALFAARRRVFSESRSTPESGK